MDQSSTVSFTEALANNQTLASNVLKNVSSSAFGNQTDTVNLVPLDRYHDTRPVPVLGIVFPLLTIIPIFIGLGFSFYRYHQRMKRLMYRKGIVPPNERPRIKAPSAAMNWEMEFSTLFDEAKEKSKDTDATKDTNFGKSSKKYEVDHDKNRQSHSKIAAKNSLPEVHYGTDVTTGHFWAAPRKMSAELEVMPVVMNREIKFNSKQDDKSKRKLLDSTI